MEFKTRSELFVLSKKADWEELRNILNSITKKGFKALKEEEIKRFPRLYRMCCTDLAEANMLKLSPDVITYLNELVGQAHKYLYSFPPIKNRDIIFFFTNTLPKTFFRYWIYILISALLFLSSYFFSYLYVVKEPSRAHLLLPEEMITYMEESYSREMDQNRSDLFKGFMSTFYIYNNVSIGFASFALGILAGLGTVYIILYNGILLGAVTGYLVGIGYGKNFFNFVTGHSVFELTGLIVTGASGLLLGFSIIKATRYYRRDWLKIKIPEIFTVLMAGSSMIFCAAFIEGFVSPTKLPYPVKAAAALISASLIMLYYFIYPVFKRDRKT